MRVLARRPVLWLIAVVALAATFLGGRLTAGSAPPPGEFADGLRAGLAQGRQEGRTLAEGAGLPADQAAAVRAAYGDGYADGANDVFGGYDGGWAVGTRYLITLAAGTGRITYRIASRDPAP